MKLVFSAAVALALIVFTAPNALAERVTTSEISSILTEQGYNVKDLDGSKVRVEVQGYNIIIWLDGADGDVSYITWLNSVSASELGLKFLNDFNNEVKFGRAYVDGEGDVTIQMDRNSAGGVSAENIESDFNVFLMLIGKFLSDLEAQAVV